MPGLTKRAAGGFLQLPGAARLLAGAAARLGRAVVLVYHRVVPTTPRQPVVVPTVSVDTLRAHIEAIQELADIVPAAELVADPGRRTRLRVALTFDDDARSHVDHALPLLESLDVAATFFLSGRALHGRPGYWWDALEGDLVEGDLAAVAARLGVDAATVGDLVAAVEEDPVRQADLVDRAPPAALLADDIERLARSMTVGFHTVDHPVLTRVPVADAQRALLEGRDVLEEAAGRPVDLFAYPHGQADPILARLAAASGYRAAFTGRPGRVAPGTDPHLVPRWEAGPLSPEALQVRLLARLVEPAGRSRRG